MADEQRELQGGPVRPPLHTRFRKGPSGNRGGRSRKKLHALLADALSEPVFVTIDGERRQITKREAIVHQLVNKSATADLRATKMLFDMIKDVEQKVSVTLPVPEPRRLDAGTRRRCKISSTGYDGKSWPRRPQKASRRQVPRKRDYRFRRGHPLRRLRKKPQ